MVALIVGWWVRRAERSQDGRKQTAGGSAIRTRHEPEPPAAPSPLIQLWAASYEGSKRHAWKRKTRQRSVRNTVAEPLARSEKLTCPQSRGRKGGHLEQAQYRFGFARCAPAQCLQREGASKKANRRGSTRASTRVDNHRRPQCKSKNPPGDQLGELARGREQPQLTVTQRNRKPPPDYQKNF